MDLAAAPPITHRPVKDNTMRTGNIRVGGYVVAFCLSVTQVCLGNKPDPPNMVVAPPDRIQVAIPVDFMPDDPSDAENNGRRKPKKADLRNVGRRTLVLCRYSVRSDDFRLRYWSKSSGYQQIDQPPPVRTYRGFAKENLNERVCAVLYADGRLEACATSGRRWCWQTKDPVDVSRQIHGPPGTDEGKSHWPAAAIRRSHGGGPLLTFPISRPLLRTQLAADVANVCVRKLGDIDSAIAWSEWEISKADEAYVRNLALSIELTDVIVRKDPFFPGDGCRDVLPVLTNHWKTKEARGNWDFVNGFLGPAGGVSSQGRPFSAGPVLHELGHSINMGHEVYGIDMQNPISHDAALLFFEAKQLYHRFVSASRFSGEFSFLVHPYTAPDIVSMKPNDTVTIPVMANDWDSNGQRIRLKSFTTKTRAGGTVTKQEIDGRYHLDPKEALVYQAPEGYVGKDAIIYTVENESGLYQSEVVHLSIIDKQTQYAAHWPMDMEGRNRLAQLVNTIRAEQTLIPPADAQTVSGVRGNALQIREGQDIICGDVDILPERPDGFLPMHKPKWGWYPLEERIGNLFDPLGEDYSASFWFRQSDWDSRNNPGGKPAFKKNPDDRSHAETRDVIFEKTDTDLLNSVGFRVSTQANELKLSIRPFNGHRLKEKQATIAHHHKIQRDKWHHVAIVIDRRHDKATIWLDGIPSKAELSIQPRSIIFAGRGDLRLRCPEGRVMRFDDLLIAYRAFQADEVKRLAEKNR